MRLCGKECVYITVSYNLQIMDGVGVNFQKSISMATDLEDIVQIHSAYLQSQYDRCFLSPKVSDAQHIITTLGNVQSAKLILPHLPQIFAYVLHR